MVGTYCMANSSVAVSKTPILLKVLPKSTTSTLLPSRSAALWMPIRRRAWATTSSSIASAVSVMYKSSSAWLMFLSKNHGLRSRTRSTRSISSSTLTLSNSSITQPPSTILVRHLPTIS